MTLPDAPAITGAYNFRSLSGMAARDGRVIKPHVLMRSAHLVRLTEADWHLLQELGLHTICDLRGASEAAAAPTVVPAKVPLRRLHFDIRNDVRSDPSLAESLRLNPTPAGAQQLMLEIYTRFPTAMAPRLKELFDLLIDDEGCATLLIHCTAGKDRTGFLVALILHALGVPEESVMADYLLTPPSRGLADPRLVHLRQHFMDASGFELPLEAVLPILAVDRGYLGAGWQVLDRDFGGADEYLLRFAGIDEARRERLRERMLK
jgi:protein-tyrosine phosphatase